MNTPSYGEQKILLSKCFKGLEWFTVKQLSKELGRESDYLNAFLKNMVEKKVLNRNYNMGRAAHYKKPDHSVLDIMSRSWRRHTNEELGCGSTYFGRYYALETLNG